MATHKMIEGRLDRTMISKGWSRVVVDKLDNIFQPDRVYVRRHETSLIFEIKPDPISIAEVQRGVGQCIFYLGYQVKPYLVLPELQALRILPILKYTPLIGLLSYAENMTILQKADDRDVSNLKPLKEIRAKLLKGELLAFVEAQCGEWGKVPLEFIMEKLHEYFAYSRMYAPVVARTLINAGYYHVVEDKVVSFVFNE